MTPTTRHETHYWIFSPILAAQLGWVAYHGQLGLGTGFLLFALGLFAWSLLEYVLHRFSFHSKSEHRFVRPFNSGLHLLHHRQPADLRYVGAPIVLAFPVYALSLGLFRWLGGDTERAFTLGAGMLAGFLFYEFVHYTTHQRAPRTPYLRYLKKHHMLHHHADRNSLFGVTSPLWDWVFGTLKHHVQARSGTGDAPPSITKAS